jgi:phage terminase large subunit GpA-like protein
MWSSQTGKTTMQLIQLAYIIAMEPGPVINVQADLHAAEKFSKDRLSPLFRDCQAVAAKVAPMKARDSGSTIYGRKFIGGQVNIVGSNSPSGLSASPNRFVQMDELDRWQASAGVEGDQEKLAEARAKRFPNRKICKVSSPSVKGASRIAAAFSRNSTEEELEHPCPACGLLQVLRWKNFEWPDGEPEKVAYRCEGCYSLIHQNQRAWMQSRVSWRVNNPDAPNYSSRLAEFQTTYSRPWPELALEWMEAQGNPERIKAFLNTVCAELWDDQAQANVKEAELLERREQYGPAVPDAAAVLTAGVDVQDDRVEVSVYAWGAGEESWLMEHRVIPGDPGQPAIWSALDAYLGQSWSHSVLGQINVAAACIDSGGHFTAQVCRFAEERRGRRIWAIKGLGGAGHRVWPPKQSKATRGKVYLIGVDALKQTLQGRQRIKEAGPGYIHLPVTVGLPFMEQLLSEYVKTEYRRGVPVRTWERRKGRAAEAWDGAVYALAAVYGLQSHGLHVDNEVARAKSLAEVGQRAVKQQPEATGGGWLGNRGKGWLG